MLQLTLDQGEYVMVDGNIRVTYDRLGSNKQLVLSFDAPKDVKIIRQRIYEENLIKEAGMDTLDGRRLAAQFEAERQERKQASMERIEKHKKRNRNKKEARRLDQENQQQAALRVVAN